jgi:transposase, IS30 family
MNYSHLNDQDRTLFWHLLQAGIKISVIAERLGYHRSTLYRERQRNSVMTEAGSLVYHPETAQACAQQRATVANSRCRIEPWVYCAAYDYLQHCDLSPARIADELPISHEWLYQWLYREIGRGADWAQHLRTGRVSRHRRRHRQTAAAQGVSAALPITERPDACELRLEFGHWEADLLLGRKDNCFAVLVLKERLSRLTLVARVRNQTSRVVMRAMSVLLRPYQGQVKTLTTDNGKEFFHHQAFAAEFGCQLYRCAPHSPWERGQVEGENKNLRQYLPKGFNADKLTTKQLREAERRINVRPRCVLYGMSAQQVAEELSGVALRY